MKGSENNENKVMIKKKINEELKQYQKNVKRI